MPVLASQASLIPYQGEGGSASASVGEGDTDIPMLRDMESEPLIWDMVIHTTGWVTSHPMGIHIDIHELYSCHNTIGVTKTS